MMPTPQTCRARAVAPLVVAALWCVAPQAAYAQDETRLAKALADATEDYDLLMLDEAEQKLREAIAYAEKQQLRGPQVGKLHVMLAIVIYARDRDPRATEAILVKAVEADPQAQIEGVYETPDLTKLMNDARKKAKPAPSQPPKPGAVSEFRHAPITRATGNQPLTVEAFVPQDMPVFRMFVYHRRYGEEGFKSAELDIDRADPSRFVAVIPADQVRTRLIEYYIVGQDRAGRALARFADEANPATILVSGASGAGEVAGPGPSDPGEPAVNTEEEKNVYFSLGGGTGVGLLTGGTPTTFPNSEVKVGFAPTIGHGMFGLGWIIDADMRLGLYFRLQPVPVQSFEGLPASATERTLGDECLGLGLGSDCLIGLKYQYFITEGVDDVRFYTSVGLGVGRVRNWLRIKEYAYEAQLGPGGVQVPTANCQNKEIYIESNGDEYCYVRDTVRTGWGHFALGGGLTAPLAKSVEFYADATLMILTLDMTSVNVDATIGFNFKF